MAVLGLILLAAAGVLTAAVVTSNTDSLAVDLWGVSVSNVTLGVVFVAGMITTVVAVVGLGLLMGGVRRNRRLRKERRTLRRENEQLAQRVDTTPDTSASAGQYDSRTAADTTRDRGYADRQVDDHTPRAVHPGPTTTTRPTGRPRHRVGARSCRAARTARRTRRSPAKAELSWRGGRHLVSPTPPSCRGRLTASIHRSRPRRGGGGVYAETPQADPPGHLHL